MALNLTINLTDVEELALKYVAADPQDWLDSFVRYRVNLAMDEIYQKEAARLAASGAESVPTNKALVVQSAFDNKTVLTVVEANAKATEEMLAMQQAMPMSQSVQDAPPPPPPPIPPEPTA